MKEEVSHTRRIVSITPSFTTVTFVSHAACSSCHAAGLCGMAEYAEKSVQVPTDPYASYSVGEEVEVVLKATMGLKAVWISYVIPLFILMILVLSLSMLHVGELAAGLSGIAGVAVYWGVVWLLRDRLRNEYVFTIRKHN